MSLVPSGAPLNLTANPVSSTSILITWEPPPIYLQNGVIRQYNIHYYISETRESVLWQSDDNSTSIILTDLHPYYTYSITVAAVTIGAGPQSEEATTRTLESGKFLHTTLPRTPMNMCI